MPSHDNHAGPHTRAQPLPFQPPRPLPAPHLLYAPACHTLPRTIPAVWAAPPPPHAQLHTPRLFLPTTAPYTPMSLMNPAHARPPTYHPPRTLPTPHVPPTPPIHKPTTTHTHTPTGTHPLPLTPTPSHYHPPANSSSFSSAMISSSVGSTIVSSASRWLSMVCDDDLVITRQSSTRQYWDRRKDTGCRCEDVRWPLGIV